MQIKDRKSNVEQWKRDREQWADHGFKVLGVEIGHLPEHQQVALLAGGVFFFLLIYGYMQVTTAFVTRDWAANPPDRETCVPLHRCRCVARLSKMCLNCYRIVRCVVVVVKRIVCFTRP